jgi:type III secretion protein T
MLEAVLKLQDDLGAVTRLMVLGYIRPFGFSMIFMGFTWGSLNSSLLRTAFALAIALPVVVPGMPEVIEKGLPQEMELITLAVKELLIGFALGYVASLPFAIVTSAGGIIDIYRGSAEPTPDPSGGMASPYGLAFQVMNMWIFAAAGGFMLIISIIYESYRTWPLLDVVPTMDNRGIEAAIMVLEAIGIGALIMAGPLLLLMFLVDMFVGLGGKVAPRLQMNGFDMLVKNLLLAVLMPFYLTVLLRVMENNMHELVSFRSFLEMVAP